MKYTVTVVVSFDNERLQLGSKELKEVVFPCNLMDADLSLSPGVCEQHASVSFYDRNKIIKERFTSGLSTEATVTISTYGSDGSLVESVSYTSADYKLENDDDYVTINCADRTRMFKDINVSRAPVEQRTVASLLETFFALLPLDSDWAYLDQETQSRCENIVVPDCWYTEGSLYDFLNKICVLGLLRIFCRSNKFFVARCV